MRLRSKWLYSLGTATILIAFILTCTFGFLYLLDDPAADIEGDAFQGDWVPSDLVRPPEPSGDPILSAYSDESVHVYFRETGYGDYTGQGWGRATPYDKTVDGYGMQNSTSALLAGQGAEYRLDVTLYGGSFAYPYYNVFGSGEVVQANDVANLGDADGSYSAFFYDYYYQFDGKPDGFLGGDWRNAEREYRDFVYGNYTYVPAETDRYLQQVIREMGFDASDPEIVARVTSYVHYAAQYNSDYDSALDEEEDIVVAFLRDYREGAYMHFASATTLLFRALGIPARYTVGYVREIEADETVIVTDYDRHAWTEVYIDGFGWVNVDSTNPDNGPDEVPPFEFPFEDSVRFEDSGKTVSISKPNFSGKKLLTVYSDTDVYSYLKVSSFGDYTGSGWDSTAVYDQTVDGYGMQYSVSDVLSRSRGDMYDIEVSLYGYQFLYPYYSSLSNGIIQTNDVVNMGNPSAFYSVSVYNYDFERDGYPRGSLSAAWAEAEREYREFVYENYLSVPASTQVFMQEIISKEGFRITDPDVVRKVLEYIRGAAEYDLGYDASLDSHQDIVVSFLRDYKEGICQHFASAATLMFRALGIPARYTTGYAASTEAGNTVDVTNASAHAWVEIYLDGIGWVAVDPTPQEYIPGGEGVEGEGEGEGEGGDGLNTSGDLSGTFDDMTGDVEEGEVPVAFTVYSDVSVGTYFRFMSFGDYRYDGWDEAVPYAEKLDGYGMQNMTSELLSQSGFPTYEITVEIMNKQFVFPYYTVLGSGGIVQANDVTNFGNTSLPYTATFYDYMYQRDGLPAGSLTGAWAAAEREYRDFVYENYLSIPTSTHNYLRQVIREEELNANDPDIIQKAAAYLDGAAEFDRFYDSALDEEDDIVVAFLRDYKEGGLHHFASAATLLYRALGIPARYTIGYAVQTEAGQTVEVSGIYHASVWTEIYLDGVGWVTMNVVGGSLLPDIQPKPDLDTSGDLSGELSDKRETTAFTVYSDSTVYSYFRLMSYGDYRYGGWNQAASYGYTVNGYGMQNSTSQRLSRAGVDTYDLVVELMGSQFLFPYYTDLGSGGIVQWDDVTNYGDTSVPYSASFYDYSYQRDGLPAGSLSGTWAEAERDYRDFVYDNYTSVPASTGRYLQQVIREQGFDDSDPDLIRNVAEYVQNAAAYNAFYDRALDASDDIVVSFLRDYKEGICQHYASAATLLYRALGIPARYTIGYAAQMRAGKVVEVTTKNAHAWVEVYLDGVGWVSVEATPPGDMPDGGPLAPPGPGEEEEKFELVIETLSASKVYDGTPIDQGNVSIEGDSQPGHTVTIYYLGSITDVGTVSNDVACVVTDRNGNDVTDQYNITKICGTLTVLPRPVTIETFSAQKAYDGTPLTAKSAHRGGFIGNETISLTFTGSQTDRGVSLNTVDNIVIMNEEGRDVTKNYSIEITYGILQVY